MTTPFPTGAHRPNQRTVSATPCAPEGAALPPPPLRLEAAPSDPAILVIDLFTVLADSGAHLRRARVSEGAYLLDVSVAGLAAIVVGHDAASAIESAIRWIERVTTRSDVEAGVELGGEA